MIYMLIRRRINLGALRHVNRRTSDRAQFTIIWLRVAIRARFGYNLYTLGCPYFTWSICYLGCEYTAAERVSCWRLATENKSSLALYSVIQSYIMFWFDNATPFFCNFPFLHWGYRERTPVTIVNPFLWSGPVKIKNKIYKQPSVNDAPRLPKAAPLAYNATIF